MRKFFQALGQEYLETRSSVGEDRLEWLIQRKMTWGIRWGLVLVFMFMFVVQPITYNPFFLLGCFYLGSFLGLVYILGQVFFCNQIHFPQLEEKIIAQLIRLGDWFFLRIILGRWL